jgi:hypothetical protein
MDNFNFKQYLFENKVGMYSKAALNENELMDSEILGKEIAKQHPELIRYRHDGETKKYQDAIFKYAGELLRDAGVSLNMVRGLANDQDWAMELVSTVGDELEHGEDVNEINPANLGAAQDAADAHFDQEEDQSYGNIMESAYGNVGSMEKIAPVETSLNKYLDLVNRHDFFHHFSDDPRAWNQGQAEKEMLKSLYASIPSVEKQKAMDAFVDKYLHLHDPKQFPNAANNVKYITTDTFKGAI